MVRASTPFVSKLDTKNDVCLHIKGVSVIIEFNHHSIKQGIHRTIFESSVVNIIKKGFHQITKLQPDERFLMIDKELRITVVGTTYYEGTELVIPIISVIDHIEPSNIRDTLTIAV